jgi:hypothetical protein
LHSAQETRIGGGTGFQRGLQACHPRPTSTHAGTVRRVTLAGMPQNPAHLAGLFFRAITAPTPATAHATAAAHPQTRIAAYLGLRSLFEKGWAGLPRLSGEFPNDFRPGKNDLFEDDR